MIAYVWQSGDRCGVSYVPSMSDALHLADSEEDHQRDIYLHSQGHRDSLARRIFDLRVRLMHANSKDQLNLKDEIARLTAEEEGLRK